MIIGKIIIPDENFKNMYNNKGNKMYKKYKMEFQLVNWFPDFKGFGFKRFEGSLALIYKWSIWLGYLEIRRWR